MDASGSSGLSFPLVSFWVHRGPWLSDCAQFAASLSPDGRDLHRSGDTHGDRGSLCRLSTLLLSECHYYGATGWSTDEAASDRTTRECAYFSKGGCSK